jgi:hypothetical protein
MNVSYHNGSPLSSSRLKGLSVYPLLTRVLCSVLVVVILSRTLLTLILVLPPLFVCGLTMFGLDARTVHVVTMLVYILEVWECFDNQQIDA